MKKLIILFLLPFALKAQTYTSPVMRSAGMSVKNEFTIEKSDTMFLFTDQVRKSTTKYRITSKGLNGNQYKATDGINNFLISIEENQKPVKVKGKEYTKWVTLVAPSASATYYIN